MYKPERGLFTYQPIQDAYVCSQGKVLPGVGLRMEQGSPKYYYYSKTSDCGQCSLKAACCGKRRYKQLSVTAFRSYYQHMQARLQSWQGQGMKRRRSSTVEPVFGSLLNYDGLRRVNTPGREAAHKIMLLAATAYNLQKYLAFAGGPKAKGKALTKSPKESPYFFVPLQLWLLIALLNETSLVQHPPPYKRELNCTEKGSITSRGGVEAEESWSNGPTLVFRYSAQQKILPSWKSHLTTLCLRIRLYLKWDKWLR